MSPVETRSRGDPDLGRGLTCCARNKSFLYLGFAYEKELGTAPCPEGEGAFWARNTIMNGEGLQVLEPLESLMLYPPDSENYVKKLQAKFHSPIADMSANFFSLPDSEATPEYLPLWDEEDLSVELWRN